MTDSGLMASLLNWNIERIRFDTDRIGKLVETFAFNEIATQVDASDNLYQLQHYRDRQQREIDFIIEHEDGAMLGIKIKSGTNIGVNNFRHLKWFRETLTGNRNFTGIILYAGKHIFGKNMLAVPFGALWSTAKKS